MKGYENVREVIENSVKKYPDNIAFKIKKTIEKKVTYKDVTYSMLGRDIEAMGKYLLANGLDKKRIAVVGKNCYEWMLMMLSVLSVNGVIIPLDRDLSEDILEEQIDRVEAEALFYVGNYSKVMQNRDGFLKIDMETPVFYDMLSEGGRQDNAEEYKNIKIDNDKMSILLFTSGTSAASKAVMLSQRNIASNVYSLGRWEKFTPEDINLALLPFHHTFGMTQIILFLERGMCNAFCEGLRIAQGLAEYKASVLVCVPRVVEEMYKKVQKALKRTGKLETVERGIKIAGILRKFGIDIRRRLMKPLLSQLGGGLAKIVVGAAPADPDVLKWFNDIGILTVQGYGLTETSPVLSAENDKYLRRGSVGKAMPGIDIKIVDADKYGVGEIAARGENVMLGYYNDEVSTSAVMRDGFFLTGDLGRIDKDGYLFITGRKKNVIVLNNGKNVYPEELEMSLMKSEYVRECIVYNSVKNEKDCLSTKIVYDDALDMANVREKISAFIKEMNEKLPIYKQIKEFELTAKEFEKTTTLKIKRYSTAK